MSRTSEPHSIAELLDDPIARLLTKSDDANRCVLQLELPRMACVLARALVGEPGQ
jgi:hypothetical protein